MAFKMTGMNFGTGTGSAKGLSKTSGPFTKPFKQEEDPWAKALKNDPNLSNLVKIRDKHKKGTPEYDAAQNRVNKAYKDATRHGVTSTTETKRGGKKEITTTVTPGIDTKVTKTKRDRHGNIIKEKIDTTPSDYYPDEEATREKQKRGKDKEFGTGDDKKKKKKKGKAWKETKVGQFLGAGGKEERQKRRAEREQKRAKKKGKILKEDKGFVQEEEGKTWTQTGGFGETDQSGKQVWEWVPNKKSKKSDPFSKKYIYKK